MSDAQYRRLTRVLKLTRDILRILVLLSVLGLNGDNGGGGAPCATPPGGPRATTPEGLLTAVSRHEPLQERRQGALSAARTAVR